MSWIVEMFVPLDKRLEDTKSVIMKLYELRFTDGTLRHIDSYIDPCIQQIKYYKNAFQQLEKEYTWDEIVYPCIKECLDFLTNLYNISTSIKRMKIGENIELILSWDKTKEYSYPVKHACNKISSNILNEKDTSIVDALSKDIFEIAHRLKIESEYYKTYVIDRFIELSQYMPSAEIVINDTLHDIKSILRMKPGDLREEKMWILLEDIHETLEICFSEFLASTKACEFRKIEFLLIEDLKRFVNPEIETVIHLLKDGRNEI